MNSGRSYLITAEPIICTLNLGLHYCTCHGNIRSTLIYAYFDRFVIIPLLTNMYFISSFRIFRVESRRTTNLHMNVLSYASLSERWCNKSTFVCKQGVLYLRLPRYFDRYLISSVFRVESWSKTLLKAL